MAHVGVSRAQGRALRDCGRVLSSWAWLDVPQSPPKGISIRLGIVHDRKGKPVSVVVSAPPGGKTTVHIEYPNIHGRIFTTLFFFFFSFASH